MQCGRATISDLLECPLPCILHWNQNHFVVLYKIDKNGHRFWIADPGKGKYKLSLEEFSSLWVSTKSSQCDKGIAMFTYGNGEPCSDIYSFDIICFATCFGFLLHFYFTIFFYFTNFAPT